jgi:hypothetical protein
MKTRLIVIVLNACVLALAWTHVSEWSKVDRFSGVGGPEVYRAERRAQLEGARKRLEHLSPEVRERELAAIDDQIQELDRNLPADELGEEARRVK